MKNTTVLDTNVILRFLLNDHPAHFQRAQVFMSDVISGKITAYIPDSVLAECVYVLLKVYKVPKPKACEVLTGILSYPGISQLNREILINSLVYLQHITLTSSMPLFTPQQNNKIGMCLVSTRI